MLLSALKKITFLVQVKMSKEGIKCCDVARESNNHNSGHFKALKMSFNTYIARLAL